MNRDRKPDPVKKKTPPPIPPHLPQAQNQATQELDDKDLEQIVDAAAARPPAAL